MRSYIPKLSIIIVIMAALSMSCAASTRTTALTTVELGVNAASAALVAYDKDHQVDIANTAAEASAKATSLEAGKAALADGRAKLAAYLAKRAIVDKLLIAAWSAISIATTINDDPSLTGAQEALKQLVAAVVALTGGGK
jgi:hypothetical protein